MSKFPRESRLHRDKKKFDDLCTELKRLEWGTKLEPTPDEIWDPVQKATGQAADRLLAAAPTSLEEVACKLEVLADPTWGLPLSGDTESMNWCVVQCLTVIREEIESRRFIEKSGITREQASSDPAAAMGFDIARRWGRVMTLDQAHIDRGGRREAEAETKRVDAIYRRENRTVTELEERLPKTPARTIAGVIVKLYFASRNIADGLECGTHANGRRVLSVFTELRAGATAAAALARLEPASQSIVALAKKQRRRLYLSEALVAGAAFDLQRLVKTERRRRAA